MNKTVYDRFREKHTCICHTMCWLWTGPVNAGGYGTMVADGRSRLAHRISYKLQHGAFDENLKVLHKCDTPRCVNPDHLFLGTQADNVADCVSKSRHSALSHRMSPQQVATIRMWARRGMSVQQVAKRVGVSHSTVRAYTEVSQ